MDGELGDYIQIIHEQVRKANVPYDQRDEAFSEGLVVLAEALKTFDETRGIPIRAYIRKRLRWSLFSWMRAELSIIDGRFYLGDTDPMADASNVDEFDLLDALLWAWDAQLTDAERKTLLGFAEGMNSAEVGRIVRANGKQLVALRASALAKLWREVA